MEANGASGAGGGKGSNGGNAAAASSAASASQKLRKRTKTGCLTCRRRRIKCGEERPICSNCIKSKRTCEGYSQRISWKQPMGEWGGLAEDGQQLPFQHAMLAPPMGSWRPLPPTIETPGFVPVQIAHGQPYSVGENGEPIFTPPNSATPYMQTMHGLPLTSPQTAYPQAWTPVTPQYHQTMFGQSPMSAVSTHSLPPNFPAPLPQQMHMAAVPPQQGALPNNEQMFQQLRRPSHVAAELPTPTSSVHQESATYFPGTSLPPSADESLAPQLVAPAGWWQTPGSTSAEQSGVPEGSWAATAGPTAGEPTPIISPAVSAPQAAKFLGTNLMGATAQFLEDAAVETHEDGYYDVESDEEMELAPEKTFQQLSLMRKLHQDHLNEQSMRRYDTFLYTGMLDHYRAEEHANPLGNHKTARVFAHFIFATGPSLSIFERHPRNPSALFNETPSDHSQGLWTYTLPMMALRHQGLLHAMLALASLHISKLQGTSSMPSYKHYAYAIKRIHKSVGVASKKLLPTTIAATLLLGFYEILTADHLKWSSHLAGAKQLLQQIPFKRMAKESRRMKAQQLAQKDQLAFYDVGHPGLAPAQNFRDISATIDESLISNLMGRQVRVEQFGHVVDEDEDDSSYGGASSMFDLDKYEIYQDLYWWYARQDVYQAILSGNKLLLDYHRWTDCPPRASMGRSDAIYGTHDHLILIFARIADFNARDRRRKIKVMDSNGGHWRPPPGMNMPSPPGPPPAQGMPQHANNPNAPYMHPGGPQGQGPMPQTPTRPSMDPSALGYGQGPPPNMGYGQAPMPQGFAGFPGGPNAPPFMGAGPPTALPMHTAQSATGTSPNFKHERGFTDASPNAPYSAQAPGMTGPPGQSDPRYGSHGPPPPPPPPAFYGMAPLPTTVNMPSSYVTHGPNSTPSPKSEKSDYDLDAATQTALNEWGQLKAALNTFESHLGPHFQPMPADVHPATMTPFGPALFYRSHDVGIIWAMYYMACIILHRAHPHMPPAALMASGIAARQTALYATRIGQIVGGIAPPVMGPDLSPNLGACLCEASLPLFFAGVQYQDNDQRLWLVNLLRNVEIRTGWKSIGMVAQGCETSWEKAGQMGRGPPYTRRLDQWHVETAYDSRVARITGNYTALDHEHPDLSGRIPRDVQGTRVHWAMGILGVVEDGDESESRHVSGIQPSKTPLD